MRTLIHLVRHAEVENPSNIWYGRLEGFQLSNHGLKQAGALGQHFSNHKLSAVYTSPLERARQTAEAIATPQGLVPKDEPDIIESETRLQGKFGDRRLFRNPLRARYFINPLRPSWGESYASTSSRMLSAINRMVVSHRGEEVVAVSHMTPIIVARIYVEGRRTPAWASGIVAGKASITTLEFEDDRHVLTEYVDIGSSVERDHE